MNVDPAAEPFDKAGLGWGVVALPKEKLDGATGGVAVAAENPKSDR